MPLTSMRAWLAPRPIAHYALLLLLALVAALGVLASFVFNDAARLRERIAQTDQVLAQQELKESIAVLSRHAEDAAAALVQWDEARQQLETPAYYGYWRNTRALSAGVLPEGLVALDLYDRRGRNLSAFPEKEASMPPQIDPQNMAPFLQRENGRYYLYFFFPFQQGTGRKDPAGYAGLKFDFERELRVLWSFRYLKLTGLHFDKAEGERIPFDALASTIHFDTVDNPETRELEVLVTRSFYEISLIIAAVSLIGYVALVSVVTKPLRRLSSHIDSMRRGRTQGQLLDDTYRGMLAVTELENVRHSLNDYQHQLDDMHVSLAHKNEELWTLAHQDPLTGIFNRRAFDDDWRAMLRSNRDAPLNVSFLLFDCDHFKPINDTYGHQVGDRVIEGLALSLGSALRAGDRLYRLGGDEFATVLFATDIERARQVAERCVEGVMQHDFTAYGVMEPVRVSVGIACLDEADARVDTLQRLHRQADIAMYYAKRPGQSKIAIYSEEMGEDLEAVVSSAETSAVYEAMSDPSRLEMHYQPVLDLSTSRFDYYEALVRIRGSQGLIMPSSIFPVVELRGLECELDLAVLERIRADMETGLVPEGAGVSLNVSGPGIVSQRVNDKLMQFVPLLATHKLVLEVTETSLITQIAQASANLARLRKAGFIIALDDFGSGYSSLRYLSSMPVDLVKFDISMVHSLEESGRQAMFVEDLARMIRDAGYRLVAEGIESAPLLAKVRQLGFSHAQGFHIGRPAALDRQPVLQRASV